MSRIRSVHPGLFTDEGFVSLSPMARILNIGLWTECDDDGIFEWSPLKLKMRLLPADNADAAALLAEMVASNIVLRYEVAGRPYGAIRNFCQYQRPQKPKAIHPKTEAVEDYINLAAREKRNGQQPVQDEYDTPTELPRQMEDGGGKVETDLANAKPVKAPRKRNAAASPPKVGGFELPDWIPEEPWQAFVDMRREMERGPKKIPFTVGAAKGIVEKLEGFRADGHDIGAILKNSAINGYRGVFAPDHPPEQPKAAASPKSETERIAELENFAAKASTEAQRQWARDEAARLRKATPLGPVANDLVAQAQARMTH